MGLDKKTRAEKKEAKIVAKRESRHKDRQSFEKLVRTGKFEEIDQFNEIEKPKG